MTSSSTKGVSASPFLRARWESLLLLNYECPEGPLAPLVPAGTELDRWQGRTLVSLVGFMFRDTRVVGVGIPGHRTFEEVNLRFYVIRTTPGGETRRAVVFIRELVPRQLIARVARIVYNEPYLAVPMSHDVSLDPASGGTVAYSWTFRGARCEMRAAPTGRARGTGSGTEAEFITEHFWGYTRQRDWGTLEYRVEHPRWDVWKVDSATFTGDAKELYGPSFAAILDGPIRSAFVAVGSAVAVFPGRRIG
jgi:uncharacterized protein YqjF (DUF2071 family)